MNQERIQKRITKHKETSYEYTGPFPVPPVEVNISDVLLDKLLEEIDEVLPS